MKRISTFLLGVFVALSLQSLAHQQHRTPRCEFENLSPRSGPQRVQRFVRCMARVTPGVSVAKALSVASCESGFNARASNGGAFLGVYQHAAGLWPQRARSHGFAGHSAFDPRANVTVTMRMVDTGGWQMWECT